MKRSSITLAVLLMLSASAAKADINITVTPGPGGSTVVNGSGSGVITHTAEPDSFFGGRFWEYEFFGFDTDWYVPGDTNRGTGLVFGSDGTGDDGTGNLDPSGLLTNLTTGMSVPIRDMQLASVSSFDAGNNTSGPPEDFEGKPLFRFRVSGVDTGSGFMDPLPLSMGDEYEISFSARSEEPGNFDTPFSNLVKGVYTTVRDPNNGYFHDARTEVFGTFTMTIVPEPSAIALVALGCGALAVSRGRRKVSC